ncbi:G-protein coupled receptor family C group 6 member A-like [Kryptolebias marmoratus]|uniref:G-protein coupled receptor family C group 6 member A-like n=1 Tax=Kryptolebias marmoratus TaxID=37003 RepID=UPI0018ACDBE6|nr:G-protein coupled receptor family C group 6 member A-like [Kryptolebias marmoratus]
MLLLGLLLSFLSVFHSHSGHDTGLHVHSPGDIIIGGLFPIHLKTNRSEIPGNIFCSDYNFQMFLRTQVMIYAIEEINQRTPRLLPNITLGYDIYDTCGDVSLAIKATLQLIKNQSELQSCLLPDHINSSLPKPQTKVVIGERYSEVSTAVARILALPSVTQISYASTSELLSKKFKFPTFFRTVPSDEFQTKAIYELVKEFNWKTVAIVGSDDEYGKYGSNRLQYIFSKSDVCVDFVEILSGDFLESSSDTNEILMDLKDKIDDSLAEAIIMFTKGTFVEAILKAVIENNMNRTWIASDSWSISAKLSTMPGIEKIGQVFGFTFKRNEVPGFRDLVRSMFNGSENDLLEYHLSHYPLCSDDPEEIIECNLSMECSDPKCLAKFVDQDQSYSIYLAVQVIAEGLRRLLKCDIHSCERTEFTAFELLKEIQNTNITVNTTNIYFNNGDPSLGYDIVYWNKSETNKGMKIEPIGEYWPSRNISLPDDLTAKIKTVKVSVFNCSKICLPGNWLKVKGEKCCFECVKCPERQVSNGTKCEDCGERMYASEIGDKCFNKTDDFLFWTDPASILLSVFTCLAIIIMIAFGIVIRLNCHTPVVKAVGGCACFFELLSLLFNSCLTFTFLGKPTKYSCVGIPLFGYGFSVCMACILANLLQIMLGFNFDVRVRTWIKRLHQPIAVIVIISGIQLAVSLTWLILFLPSPTEMEDTKTILHSCGMNNQFEKFFAATVSYNAFLGFICFLFAFKSKQLPDLYKNASLITVSMVLFLIVWIIFLPLFLTLEGRYKPVISAAAILISTYSVLSCHLAPKCYIIVFRKELNNQNAISEYIRKHYEQKGITVGKKS